MKCALYRVKTTANSKLDQDEYVHQMMEDLMVKYPQITGYQFERVDPIHIQILLWGDIEIV